MQMFEIPLHKNNSYDLHRVITHSIVLIIVDSCTLQRNIKLRLLFKTVHTCPIYLLKCFSLDSSSSIMDDNDVYILVKYTGSVTWHPPVILKSSCSINVDKFPFDIQKCLLILGSWTYGEKELKIKIGENVKNTTELENPEWKVIDITYTITNHIYIDYDDYYPLLNMEITMEREPQFYIFNIVFPCILLMFIGSLTFCLPPSSEEKVSLSVTVFLALMVLMMAIMDDIPASATNPPLLRKNIYCFYYM